MKKIFLSALLVAGLLPIAPAVSNATGALGPGEIDTSKYQYISLQDASFGPWDSRITSYGGKNDSQRCSDWSGICSLERTNERQISANLNFEVCSETQKFDCVQSVVIGGQQAQLYSLDGAKTAGSPAHTLPSGSGPALASIGDELFIVSSRGEYQYDRDKRYFLTRALDVDVVPVETAVSLNLKEGASAASGSPATADQTCYYTDGYHCYVEDRQRLAKRQIDLVLHLSTKWSGFFKGRLTDPLLTVKKQGGVQVVSVSAKPSETHRVFFKIDWDKFGDKEQKALCFGTSWCQPMEKGSTGTRNYLSSAPSALAIVQAFAAHHRDTSYLDDFEWSFGIGRYEGSDCLGPNKGLLGMVTSNAPIFQATPPTYNFGYLTYDIAGLHYKQDGKTLNLGEYDLQLRSDVARCLYGFSKAPVSATVQVISDAGKEVVATTLVSESQGFVRLSAKNFTYSQKKIRVKLTQPALTALAPFASNSSTLGKSQAAALSKTLKAVQKNAGLTCTSIFSSEANRKLALKQATAVCAAAKKLRPDLKTEAVVAPLSGSGQKAGVTLLRSY